MKQHFLDRFLETARKFPRNVAIDESSGNVSYEALLQRVKRLAHIFASESDAPRVLICMPKQADAYAAMPAALLAGGFYSPVNASISDKRLEHIVRTLEPDIVLTTTAYAWERDNVFASMPDSVRILHADTIPAEGETLEEPQTPHRLAYTMFTSGSTGMPKGVMVPQDALVHFLNWQFAELPMEPEDRVSQHPNIGFDLSVMDIYGAFCSGATLVVLASEMERLFPARAIRDRNITIWHSVPSIISLMQRAGQVTPEYLASLRRMLLLGEALLPEQVEAVLSARPDLPIYNTYGPTEATVAVTAVKLTSENYRQYCRHNVAIGDTFGENRIHLVGGSHEDEGEIVISGPQLADGYMNDVEKTRAAFRSVPELGLERAYYTGDWAERIDGNIYFRSRIDFQVKIHGNRLELGEVDAALRKVGLEHVATIAHGDELISFVEGMPKALEDPKGLRERLREYLETYAIPAKFIVIEQLPRNVNDKIDIKALAQQYAEGFFNSNEAL